LAYHYNYFGEFTKIYLDSVIKLVAKMKILNIEGIISSKADAEYFAEGEKYFSYADLEDFISNNYGEPFEAVIKSPGGSVEEGFRIYDKLKSLQVTTVAIVANSIASVIFLAGKVRKVTDSTEIRIHNAWVSAESLSGEKLNVHSLAALTELFAATDMKILQVYSSFAGQDKESKILALMAKETNVTAKMALDFGFATELVDNTYSAISFKNKVLTFSMNQIEILTNENMKTEEKITAFEKAINAMKNIFKVQMRNMVMTTDAGVSIFIEGEGDMLGKTVYIAEDGLPTETLAPAGPHSFADGSSVVLDESGVVIEVLPAAAPAAAMEELEATIAAMEDDKMKDQASIVALNAKVAAQAKVIAEGNTKLTKLTVDFKDLKNMVNGDPDTKKKNSVIPAADFAKLSYSEQIRQRAMNKV
jgi:ATP-dependent Clp protease protease subunit